MSQEHRVSVWERKVGLMFGDILLLLLPSVYRIGTFASSQLSANTLFDLPHPCHLSNA